MKALDFDTALDECLSRLQAGETVEVCLGRFPEYADDLRPLLWVAAQVRAMPILPPTAAAMEQGRERVRAASAQTPNRLLSLWGLVPFFKRVWVNGPHHMRVLAGQGARWVVSPASVLLLFGIFVSLLWWQINGPQPELPKPITPVPTNTAQPSLPTNTPEQIAQIDNPTITATPEKLLPSPTVDKPESYPGLATSTPAPSATAFIPPTPSPIAPPTAYPQPTVIPTAVPPTAPPVPTTPPATPTLWISPTSVATQFTSTPTLAPTLSPTPTPLYTATATPICPVPYICTPTLTSTPFGTPTQTRTPTVTPTLTGSITRTLTPTHTPTPTLTSTVTVTPTLSVTPTGTLPTPTPTLSVTPCMDGCL